MYSCELCGVYVCACNPRHSAGSHECYHRVSPSLSYLEGPAERDSAILASFLLDETLGRLGVCGCASCIVSLPLPHLASLWRARRN